MTSYFEIFSISPAFDLDISVLEVAYFKAQRQYHPDRFVGKPPAEKMAALQKSIDINQAYEILKNSLKRAQHLLRLQGVVVGTDADTIKPNQELLMEIMELRENGIKNIEIEKLIENSQKLVAEYYKTSKFLEMAQETLRLGYLMKISEENNKKRI